MSSESDEYVVESILDVRKDDPSGPLYLVKWVGFPHSENTWEPLRNLLHAQGILDRFLAARMLKPNYVYGRKPEIPKPEGRKILGTRVVGTQLTFDVQTDEGIVIPMGSDKAKRYCPDQYLEFLERFAYKA
jgi:hypothetical protein